MSVSPDLLLAGRYRLGEKIAAGGMGTVWRAYDQVLQREVAVKVLSGSLADDHVAAERFRREALTAASISHPNMANVFDYFEENGEPGIVMELVEGETLSQRLAREGPLPVEEAVRIATAVLDALACAHESYIVHRDVKPANILLTATGDVKVTDFGIARSLSETEITMTGTVLGTAHYSAPEQIRGRGASPATDVYATGVVLYEMLTGARPFEADTPIAVAMKRLNEDPLPVRALRPDVPASIETVVMRALARDPHARFPSAIAMRDALEARIVLDPPTAPFGLGPADPTIAFGRIADEPRVVRRTPDTPPDAYESAREPGHKRRAILLGSFAAGVVALSLLLLALMLGGSHAPVAHAKTSPTPAASHVAVCCKVPRVIGMSKDSAIARLRADGFAWFWHAVPSNAPAGTVIAQTPSAGDTLKRGETVYITISAAYAPPPGSATKPKGHHHHGDG